MLLDSRASCSDVNRCRIIIIIIISTTASAPVMIGSPQELINKVLVAPPRVVLSLLCLQMEVNPSNCSTQGVQFKLKSTCALVTFK